MSALSVVLSKANVTDPAVVGNHEIRPLRHTTVSSFTNVSSALQWIDLEANMACVASLAAQLTATATHCCRKQLHIGDVRGRSAWTVL